MRKQISFSLKILLVIFALSFLSLSCDNGFLYSGSAQGFDHSIDLDSENPGIKKAIEVQSKNSNRIMAISDDVVGHGVGISPDGDPIIKIFVTRAGIQGIPKSFEGVPTKIEVAGIILAYVDPTARFPRPVPIGVSTGHPDITAGTIGCRVKDPSGNIYALSNNHVYANQNNAQIGDVVLQPGPYDGGVNPSDAIGTLFDFAPINFSGGVNNIDGAIAISAPFDLDISTPAGDGYGVPSSSPQAATLGLAVQKFGRTTGWTHGDVVTINGVVDVCYETRGILFLRCVKEARFENQIGISPGIFSAGGDSGSLIVTDDGNKNPVGLLFAGNSSETFANPIDLVLDYFGVTIDNGASAAPFTDLAMTQVSAPSSAIVGGMVNVNVSVQNTGNQDVTTGFNIDLKDQTYTEVIGTQTVSSLAAGASTTLSFTWDTSAASLGDHALEGSHDLTDDDNTNDTARTLVSIDKAFTDIAVTEISAPSSVTVGDAVNVDVTVQNTGNQDVTTSFNVDLVDLTDAEAIGTQAVPSLAAGASTTLSFTWDTSLASSGNHTLEGSQGLTDENSINDASTTDVTVSEAGGEITLTASDKVNRRWIIVDLQWSGATSSNVDIFRNGVFLSTTSNDGAYSDKINNQGGGSFTYKVCEEGTSTCSNEVNMTF